MSTTILEVAMNLWSVSDPSQKKRLMRKFLKKHGGLAAKNDFVGFLADEVNIEKRREKKPLDLIGIDG